MVFKKILFICFISKIIVCASSNVTKIEQIIDLVEIIQQSEKLVFLKLQNKLIDVIEITEIIRNTLSSESYIDPVLYPELARFVQKFQGSSDVLDENLYYRTSGDSPIERVINAQRIKAYLQDKKLDLLAVPEIFFGYASKTDKTFGDEIGRWRSYAEKITIPEIENQMKAMPLEVVKQLAQFVQDLGFVDFAKGNIVYIPQVRKCFILDFEDRSFAEFKKIHLIMKLYHEFAGSGNQEAEKWLSDEMRRIEGLNGSQLIQPLFENTVYDRQLGFDFEKVKEEFIKYWRLVNSNRIKKWQALEAKGRVGKNVARASGKTK